jgi:hypothetical protein
MAGVLPRKVSCFLRRVNDLASKEAGLGLRLPKECGTVNTGQTRLLVEHLREQVLKPLIHTLKELEHSLNKEIVAVICPPSARWSVQGLPCKLPFLGSVTILPLLLIPIGHPIPVFDPPLILSNLCSEDGGDASPKRW